MNIIESTAKIDLVQQNLATLFNSYASLHPATSILNGTMITISPSSVTSESYGLESALYSPLFEGYQGTNLPYSSISSVEITIENQLQDFYNFHQGLGLPPAAIFHSYLLTGEVGMELQALSCLTMLILRAYLSYLGRI